MAICIVVNGENFQMPPYMAADIMNCTFQTELCLFKANRSEFKAIVAITSHPVKASKMTKTQK